MGALGGVYVWKVENGEIDYGKDGSSVLQLVFTIIPVNCFCCFRCFGQSNKNESNDLVKESKTQLENKNDQNAWINKVDFSMGLCAMGVTVFVMMAYYHTYFGWFSQWAMKFVVEWNSFTKCIIQYTLTHCFVIILIGLCQDRNNSCTSKILSLRLLRCIGRMSFHLYVIHIPIINFLILALNKHLMPIELKPIVFTLAPMLAAHVMRKSYDEPIQLLFK